MEAEQSKKYQKERPWARQGRGIPGKKIKEFAAHKGEGNICERA